MWKLVLGFIVFAALALFILAKSGGDIDMSGEKHGGDVGHGPAASEPATAAPAAASVPAVAASAAASAASN
ncbi:hypothetical protein [Aquabacterium sp. OR-4]|uniref:hypothetical protein n=1 Tax=Aquabacterium sp. OR-4 TaxID=2978127 RepID=UPI0021B22C5F|nr:hypothetical protein [Aquabacterium sp. OR-4]MDT7837391.1 hypothetical protein [Aquabacterium sp. OR-4]